MASLRLTFPEKDSPSVIALTGARLTIGRLPFNTIQIMDRTVSGFHAELIHEHGHYRLHDRGSSNGTFVNGQKVADYHLNEACTVTFGTVEAHFSPEAVEADVEAENFPTRSEINSVRKENADLKVTVEALREESDALRQTRPLENDDVTLGVTKEEFDKVVVEREALKEIQLKQLEEIDRLKTDLAVLKRDRVNLQLGYDGVQREISELRAKAGGGDEVALQPKAAAAALAAKEPAPAPDTDQEIRVEVPASTSNSTPITAKELPTFVPPKAPSAPGIRPFAPLPKSPSPAAVPQEVSAEAKAPEQAPTPVSPASPRPMSAPTPVKSPALPTPVRAFSPLPKAPAVTASGTARPVVTAAPTPVAPAGLAKAPIGLGSGIRPMTSAPITGTPVARDADAPKVQPNTPTTRLSPRPLPPGNPPSKPTVKLAATPATGAGPKGTQKL